MAQPFMRGTAKVIKPAQPLDKDPAMMSYMMAAMPLFSLFTTCFVIRGHLIFVQFGDIGLIKNFLMNHLSLLPGALLLSFPREFLNILLPLLLGRYPHPR